MDEGYSSERSDQGNSTEIDELNLLYTMIEKDDELSKYKFNEEFLFMFLRCRKSAHKAFERLQNYVKKMKQRPEVFNWDHNLHTAVDSKVVELCRSKGKDCSILIIRPKQWNPDQVSVTDIFQMVVRGIAFDENIQKNGIHLVIDSSGVTLYKLYCFGQSNVKFLAQLVDAAVPVKIRNVHVVFENSISSLFLNLMKRFICKKLQDRIHFHGNKLDELHQCCYPSALPTEFGGTCGDLAGYNYEQYKKKIDEHQHSLESVWSQFQVKK